jgi:hypothetical protein
MEVLMSAAQRIEAPSSDAETAQAVLDAFGGNALAALQSVIADADFLCDQLEMASGMLSLGIGRGWKPKFRRDE